MAVLLPPPLENPSPLPLISGKGKRDLRKQFSDKESCLSCLASPKSRKSICKPSCVSSRLGMWASIFYTLHLRDRAETHWCHHPCLGILKTAAHYFRPENSSTACCCHQLYPSHSKAFQLTRSFFLKVTTLPKEPTRYVATKTANVPPVQDYTVLFLPLKTSQSAWLLFRFTGHQHC